MTTRTTEPSTSTPTTATTSPAPSVKLPKERPGRAVVEAVRPVVDGGRFPAKAAIDRPMSIEADVFTDGHDVVSAAVLTRFVSYSARGRRSPGPWSETPMTAVVNDRFTATVVPDRLGRWEYDVVGWVTHAETWRRGTVKKHDAGLDLDLELRTGRALVDAMLAAPHEGATDDDLTALRIFADELAAGDPSSLADAHWADVFFRCEPRHPVDRFASPLAVDVDPLLATFGAWYSFFPRSTVGGGAAPASPGTLRDAIDRLDYIADLGFDVAYIPPVHPIGTTNRKGKNNLTVAAPDDVGSPYAIGAAEGGHTAVAPELGTVEDVAALADACRVRDMHLALDIAFNCSPDHPWVREHPDWFTVRPDGSIQYAENPPKKYEDIYPLNFETDDWEALWQALADVFRFWIERGVTIFRVDNPHTKAFAFWEWAITAIRREHPEVIFLSEAFTRPRVMERLAKLGFNQSYTYFAWRQAAWELREYYEDLSTRTLDYFRPTAWPNTHDILTEQMQTGGRPAFASRAVLAATLTPSWGVYGPVYELLERAPRPGVEDYLDSEKYEVRHWDLDDPASLAPLLARLNEIRRSEPALMSLETIAFHEVDNPALLCFTKTDPAGEGDPVIVVVNVDPFNVQSGTVDIDLATIGLPYDSDYDVVDRLGGATYRWSGSHNYVELSPWAAMAHVFSVQSRAVGGAVGGAGDSGEEGAAPGTAATPSEGGPA